MGLELKSECEKCGATLAPGGAAYICSYECTFCADCAAEKLDNVCPNCGGGFVSRPIRPAHEWRPGISVEHHPASAKRVHLKYSLEDIAAHSKRIKDTPPEQR